MFTSFPETVNAREFKMICPMCQRIDVVQSTLTVDSSNRYIAADTLLICPDCKCEMYEADDLLITTLAELNSINIRTHSHCARIHNGEVDTLVKSRNRHHDEIYYHGPYIMFTGLTDDQLLKLVNIIEKKNNSVYSESYYTICRTRDVMDRKLNPFIITTVEIEVKGNTFNLTEGGISLLKEICHEWVEVLRKSRLWSPKDHERMRNIRLVNYANHDPYWENKNPYHMV